MRIEQNNLFIALELSEESRRQLMAAFPPRYPNVIADHITVSIGSDDPALLFQPQSIEVTGIADDKNGLEAIVLRVNHNTHRPDGLPWHITWSMNKGAKSSKTLDPFNESPLEGQPDSRKERKYMAAMSNKLVQAALEKTDEFSFSPLAQPILIQVRPMAVNKTNPEHPQIRYINPPSLPNPALS